MIIDGHAYCFPSLSSSSGYASPEEKMRRFQRELGGHHQPVWRVRDRAPADASSLVDPDTDELREVEWNYEAKRFTWTYDGETYAKQYFPPMLHNQESSPEQLIAEMDYVGVDMALLHTSPHLGRLNDYLADAAKRYPSRLMWLVSVPDAEIPRDPDAAIRQVDQYIKAGGASYQFFTKHYYELGNTEPWDDGAMRPFWEAVTAMKVPIHFTVQAPHRVRYTADERESYLEQQSILLRWMERYPDVTVVMTHGLPWSAFMEGDRITFPDAIWDVFKAPRLNMHLLFPIQLGGKWEYPWKEAEPTVKECLEHIGADRLIWGTDMPMVARFCTYRQTLDQYRVHCEFLSDGEREAITGGTVARVMGVE